MLWLYPSEAVSCHDEHKIATNDFWHRGMNIVTIESQDLWLTICNNTSIKPLNQLSAGIYLEIENPFSIENLQIKLRIARNLLK